jgi:hypothetical protein
MRKSLLASLAGAALACTVGAAAWAQGGAAKGARPDEPKKHLAEVDAYLRDAIDNTKVLYQTTQMQPGKLDTTIQRESLNNVDKALTGMMAHVGHMKSLPEARVADMAKLDDFQRDITQARGIVGQLRAAAAKPEAREQTVSLTEQLYTVLHDADNDFNAIAEKQEFTRLDRVTVPEKQPVGGKGEAPSMEKPMEKPPVEKPSGKGGTQGY